VADEALAGAFARSKVDALEIPPPAPGARIARELKRGLTLAELRARDAEELGIDDEDDEEEEVAPAQLLAEIAEALRWMEAVERKAHAC
jgi:hypothetical protein